MSNIWKYASLPQKERASMIRNGNEDVYEAEMKRSDYLASSRKNAGLDTKEIDNWKTIITQARSKYLQEKGNDKFKVYKTAETPSFGSKAKNDAVVNYTNDMQALSAEYNREVTQARQDAENEFAALDEWLAANGLSKNGKTSRDKKNEIQQALDFKLEDFSQKYGSKLGNLSASFSKLFSTLK